MGRRLSLLLVFVLVAVVALSNIGFAEDQYPSKPIQVILPWAPGGSTDLLARSVEKVWGKYCSQPFVIINKPGGGAVIGTEYVVRSKPDGYTIYFGYGAGNDMVMPHLQKMPYDVFKDLLPVCRLSYHSVLVVTGAKSQFNTVKDMVAWAKKENKPITSSVSTKAGSVDIVLTGIGKMAGIKITTIPFAGGAESTAALAGGHVMIGGGHPSEVMPHIKAGRFKAIGIALPKREPSMPDIPTLKEQGINFYTWGSVKGIAVPAGTSPKVIKYLEGVFKKVSQDPEYIKMCEEQYSPNLYQNAKEYKKFFKKAYDEYGQSVKDLGITM